MEFHLEGNTVSLPLTKLTKLLNTLEEWMVNIVVTEDQLKVSLVGSSMLLLWSGLCPSSQAPRLPFSLQRYHY